MVRSFRTLQQDAVPPEMFPIAWELTYRTCSMSSEVNAVRACARTAHRRAPAPAPILRLLKAVPPPRTCARQYRVFHNSLLAKIQFAPRQNSRILSLFFPKCGRLFSHCDVFILHAATSECVHLNMSKPMGTDL